MTTATKPLPQPNEAVLKQNDAKYVSFVAGVMRMTIVVAFLVCCSAAVFLAHAFDAYTAQ
jgi:hypothetical protein